MKELFEWPGPSRPCDFAAFLERKRAGFVGRAWLFAEIEAWRRDGDERVLLIRGEAGVGKSAAMAELAHTNPEARVLAHHFCQSPAPVTLEPGRFVAGLAATIAARFEPYAARFEDAAIREAISPWRAATDPAGALREGLIGPLESLDAPESGPCLLILDGVEEAAACDPLSQTSILELLANGLDRLSPWIRLVAAARDEAAVSEHFPAARICRLDAGD